MAEQQHVQAPEVTDTSDLDICPVCTAPAHGRTWRCESCGAEFVCPTAIVSAELESPVMQHRALPILGLQWDSEGRGPFPLYGEAVLCGPVEEGAVRTKVQRGRELAQVQQRRSSLRVIHSIFGGGLLVVVAE